MKISGLLLPTSVAEIKTILETGDCNSESNGRYYVKVIFDVEERSSGLNFEVGSVEGVDGDGGGSAGSGRGIGMDEMMGQKIANDACGKTVRSMEFDGSWK
ncbi:hypothetical protein HK100_005307 [Physocladia obscura]|uniref:Uncharacterized protein n=1 Tax=Physocladia obscura TaxID=109957 RepID=A0AAD5XCD6_9FUNG|nr:hypothetical protein HK100_005307 [Physocladia obscura]